MKSLPVSRDNPRRRWCPSHEGPSPQPCNRRFNKSHQSLAEIQYDDNENRRRIDPVLVIKEVQAAGFEFVDYSDLHFRADDELEYEVGRRSVSGNTDRFTFLFRKP